MLETIFGPTISLSIGRVIPTRWVGEQHVQQDLGLIPSFADCWRPTAANYWGRVKKAHGLAIGAELLGERWARDHAGDKKPRPPASTS